MKKRNLAAVIFLSIVTLGMYDLYWLINTKDAMNKRNTRVQVPSFLMLFMPVGVFAAILLVETLLSAINRGGNVIINIVAILLALAGAVVLLVYPFIWLLKYCKAVSEYTNGQVNTSVAFLLLWFLRFVGVAVIQDGFNDVVDGTAPVSYTQTPHTAVSQNGGFTSVPPHLQPPAGPVSPAAQPAVSPHNVPNQQPVVPGDSSHQNGPVPPQPPVSPIS